VNTYEVSLGVASLGQDKRYPMRYGPLQVFPYDIQMREQQARDVRRSLGYDTRTLPATLPTYT